MSEEERVCMHVVCIYVVLQCGGVLQCVAVCCRVLQSVAECSIVLQCVAAFTLS